MAFFDSLRRVLGTQPLSSRVDPVKLAEAWGLADAPAPEIPGSSPAADPDPTAAPAKASAYDVEQWRKKLKRILDKLPASQPEWEPMLAEARALGLDSEWVLRNQITEFTLLMRRAVADRHITEDEHRKLELARQLIGMSEADAEALLHVVTKEAESFFGQAVEGA